MVEEGVLRSREKEATIERREKERAFVGEKR